MRTPVCLIAAVLSVASVSAAHADTVGYGVAFDELYRIDLGTRQATFIGTAGNHGGRIVAQVSGLTYGPNGLLYGVSGTHKALFRFDRTNGSAEYIGSLGVDGEPGGPQGSLDLALTFGCDGSFWMTSAVTRDLWKVDPFSGAATKIGNTGRQFSGLAARNGVLYAVGINADRGFYRIDTGSAAATLIGSFGGSIPWIDPAFGSTGTLWATLSYNPPEFRDWSDLATISPTTGALTNLGPITGPERLRNISMRGLAVAPNVCAPAGGPLPAPAALPVHSPWMLAMIALLLGAVGVRRLRRSSR